MLEARVVLALLASALVGCDPITRVRGRVVSPANGQQAPLAEAAVNVRCDGLKPDEGISSTTDATGTFEVATVGGTLPDECTVHVTPKGATAPMVNTTIGATKTRSDDRANRTRHIEVMVPNVGAPVAK